MTTTPLLTSVHDAVQWLAARVTGTLQTDSRLIQPGDGFIAWPGAATDGRAHVGDALARGAMACLVEHEGIEAFHFADAPVVALRGLKAITGTLAAEWFGHPTQSIDVLAVTGTNGKTSVSWWLADALNLLARNELAAPGGCALIGTLGAGVPPALESTGLTTPDPVRLQRAFAHFAKEGHVACAIEASSIGLAEHRLTGTRVRAALFTNFTQDHLDYHPSMAAYWQAKSTLFDWPGLQIAVVNIDDRRGAELHETLSQQPLDLWSVSLQGPARLQARDIAWGDGGLSFTVAEGAQSHVLQTRLIGHYNVGNLLLVMATLRALGLPLEHALYACAQLSPVPGRMEQIHVLHQPLVAVDYAHTPDALDQALQALRPIAAERGGRLWCVFGCGGSRDRTKRPLMGAVAQQRADAVIVTSDNPRGEVPADIVHEILQGTVAGRTVRAEVDRAAAIALALSEAGPRDVVLIAGKGHEDYQEVAGERRPFSDMAHAQAGLAARGGRA
ncbi:UDP-N-acetylmuramoyl-L-alanyl-D-glutamate--2, 6-diaminopimelate ligase [Acidovorax sp. SUPP3434]|uniref:UDP-N-acetylmuramoyl-L-alanyl-D-glutamate--2, 6-diaminopimelate ligase n=1 Tax=Acidovorax sp. SUPP3434 TaxID=2920880 RepID=UPI0023DE6993|nr:UDP-N-acetylmuramoyl-L-alanyl-D-glutamate--2,6-diaminopimelate ligase [Acidovorax sp. SUPP3434]GKS99077.1 UDP-N-acetylmuramoyl-L-alanyl-D-glutamate--2, 6-diaminopimelate ligase [Acidovorax sp. SUPP3434]